MTVVGGHPNACGRGQGASMSFGNMAPQAGQPGKT